MSLRLIMSFFRYELGDTDEEFLTNLLKFPNVLASRVVAVSCKISFIALTAVLQYSDELSTSYCSVQ